MAKAKKRTKRTRKARSKPDWAPAFLACLRSAGTILHACEAAGCSRTNVYQRRDSDPDFADALAAALEDATDSMEREAIRRGSEGYLEPVIYQGEMMGEWVGPDGLPCDRAEPGARFAPLAVRKYSDALLAQLLRWRRYRDRLEVTGRGGGPITVRRYVGIDPDGDVA